MTGAHIDIHVHNAHTHTHTRIIIVHRCKCCHSVLNKALSGSVVEKMITSLVFHCLESEKQEDPLNS